MEKDIAIHVNNLTKSYRLYNNHADRVKEALIPFRKSYHRLFNALSGVNISITRGETVGIIGRNGSGKSTLLQIISGVLQPTEGIAETKGRISALLELGAGFNPEFTGKENVYINASIMGLSKEEIDSRFPEIIKFADIGEFIDQPMKIYSSGMYVRLAFAVAINVSPDILIVDEALAVGDTLFQAKCFDKFREFQKKGVTIIFVTHALDLVVSHCSFAYLLESGRIVSQGKPKEVIDDYSRILAKCSKSDEAGIIQTKKQSCNKSSEAGLNTEKQWACTFEINPNEDRYGNEKATIIAAGIFKITGQPTQVVKKGEKIKMRMKVRFNEPVKSPIYAYTIRDIRGLNITGSNTFFKHIDIKKANAGDIFIINFTIEMMLNPGHYLISYGCTGFEDGQCIIYERRYDHMAFEVVSDTVAVGIVDLDPDIEVVKLASSDEGETVSP